MTVGDLVFDASLGQRGIIVESKVWETHVAAFGGREVEYEYTILYEDGDFDTAYENELEVVNESR